MCSKIDFRIPDIVRGGLRRPSAHQRMFCFRFSSSGVAHRRLLMKINGRINASHIRTHPSRFARTLSATALVGAALKIAGGTGII
jgi:hypothetical protein